MLSPAAAAQGGHARPELLLSTSGGSSITGTAAVLQVTEVRLQRTIEALCAAEGMSYISMTPIQRLFLTHYRCFFCKMLPLYELDVSSRNRARCGRCRHLVSLTGGGKYGKIRKRLAMAMRQQKAENEEKEEGEEGEAGGSMAVAAGPQPEAMGDGRGGGGESA